jgi:hypothetical protein
MVGDMVVGLVKMDVIMYEIVPRSKLILLGRL